LTPEGFAESYGRSARLLSRGSGSQPRSIPDNIKDAYTEWAFKIYADANAGINPFDHHGETLGNLCHQVVRPDWPTVQFENARARSNDDSSQLGGLVRAGIPFQYIGVFWTCGLYRQLIVWEDRNVDPDTDHDLQRLNSGTSSLGACRAIAHDRAKPLPFWIFSRH
jgi:hypothetical protein